MLLCPAAAGPHVPNITMKYQDKTQKTIQAFYKVYITLGYGFLEKVYQNALLIELTKMGFDCVANYPVKVYED